MYLISTCYRMMVGGGGLVHRKGKTSRADSGIYFRGAPCIGEGSGDCQVPSGSRAGPSRGPEGEFP